jgi:hypothetical protein
VLKAADQHAGRRAKCKTCGQLVTIPSAAAPSRASAGRPATAVPVAQIVSTPAKRQPVAQPMDVPLAIAVAEAQTAAPAPLAPLSGATLSALPAAGKSCPGCGKPLSPKAVLCVDCGYNLKTGRKLVRREVLSPFEDEPRRPSPAAKFFTDRIFSPKVWGGLATMAISVIWFFGALFYLEVIFFYPPILFILGAISFFSGLIDGGSD